MQKHYFLAKSELTSYSIDDLMNDKTTWWDGVHNYQAINTIKSWKIGDIIFFYHSNKDPAIVGIMEVVSLPQFDLLDIRKISWKAEVKFLQKFKNPISLKEIKNSNKFPTFALMKNSRLSVMACPHYFVDYVLDKN